MVNRQTVFNALFKLKDAGVDVSSQLNSMANSRDIPRSVIEFLRDNSPQFQFYRHIQKHQHKLAESILDYKDLSDYDKLIACSSFITRALLAVKYNNLSETLLEDLNIEEVSEALDLAINRKDYSKVNQVLNKHCESLKVFYLNNKNEKN